MNEEINARQMERPKKASVRLPFQIFSRKLLAKQPTRLPHFITFQNLTTHLLRSYISASNNSVTTAKIPSDHQPSLSRRRWRCLRDVRMAKAKYICAIKMMKTMMLLNALLLVNGLLISAACEG